jgi:hypothetical protein
LPVCEIKHTDFRQEKTHVEEDHPGEEAEDPGTSLVSEYFHAVQNYVNFFNWFQNGLIGSWILEIFNKMPLF